MKWLRKLLLAGASLLAMTAHASADPIITPLAGLLFAGPLGATFSFAGIYTTLQIAVTAGIALATSLAGGGGPAPQQANPGQYKSVFQAAETSEIRGVGRSRVGGLQVFGNTIGVYRYRLIAHSKGRIDGVEEHFLGGRPVTVEESGEVSSPPWTRPNGSWVTIQSKVGDGTETAWPVLLSDFSSLWTEDHRLRGIAQSLAIYQSPGLSEPKFLELYQAGEPAYERVQRNEVVYDPRLDTTRGGAGSQRSDDESTWAWSDNGILCALHIFRAYPDLADDDFDWTDLQAEADKADVSVATLTGAEPRSRCWGIWESQRPRGDVMLDVLRSVGADVELSDEGLIRIRLIDDVRTSDITFTDDHIVEYGLASGPKAVERPNTCAVWYYSPERNFELAEIPDLAGIEWANIAGEIARYGPKVEEIRLPYCPSASQAQRIARRLFATKRGDSGVIVTNMAGVAACDRPVVNIYFADLDETHVCEIASPRENDQGLVEIPYSVAPVLEEWNPAEHEAPAPPVIPELAYEAELETPDAPVSVTLVQYPDESYEIRTEYALLSGATEMEANFRLYEAGLPTAWASMTELSTPVYAWAAGGSVGQDVDVRVRAFDGDENGSHFSDPLNATLAMDNASPATPSADPTPTLHGDGYPTSMLFDNVSPTSLNTSFARLTRAYRPNGGSFGTPVTVTEDPVRPGQSYGILDAGLSAINPGDSWRWVLTFHASDETSSPEYTYTFTRDP